MRLDALAGGIPPDFLAVPIGRKDNGAPMVLDFKEAAAGGMGPHGMLVGATGSGKSELLRSLTAALAARHDPALLNLLLIDFKGGAAFADLAHLPHVAGLVTNLADDLSLVDRMQLALAGELPGARSSCGWPATSARSPTTRRPGPAARRSTRCPTSWSWSMSSVSCWWPSRTSTTRS